MLTEINLVVRKQNDRFGFAFIGGIDHGSISVRSVVPNSAAFQGGLKEGDVIISLNGEDTTQMSHSNFISLIRAAEDGVLNLIVKRDRGDVGRLQ
eukprot:m.92202 g.92202  ORF g.92202 m.92202 type:complete len:95 (-) comp12352_c0_seq1:2239-2523(-)